MLLSGSPPSYPATVLQHRQPSSTTSNNLFMPGKDYYDQPKYDRYYDEEERRDKGNILKTTNIEAERQARRRENDRRGDWEEGYGQRRTHQDYGEELQRGRRWDRDMWG